MKLEIESIREGIYKDLAQLPITFESTDENVKAHLLAVKMNLDFISKFEMRVNNILREKKLDTEVDDE